MHFPTLFKKITELDYYERTTNYLKNNNERTDNYFELLARVYLSTPKKIEELIFHCNEELQQNPHESINSIIAYCYYYQEKFLLSKKHLFQSLKLNPENLDNWIDLAFVYRHLNKKIISDGILYNFKLLIPLYLKTTAKITSSSKFESLIIKILTNKHNIEQRHIIKNALIKKLKKKTKLILKENR